MEIIFLCGLSESIFLITDKDATILETIKSINKLIPGSLRQEVFDQNGANIPNDMTVRHFCKKNSYSKIFLSLLQDKHTNFGELYHRQLIMNYFWNEPDYENWGKGYTKEMKGEIKNLRKSIKHKIVQKMNYGATSNCTNMNLFRKRTYSKKINIHGPTILLVNLKENQKLVKGSKFPVCKIYSECLYEICEEYMNPHVKQSFQFIFSYIRLALMIKIDDVFTEIKTSKSINLQKCYLGQILLDALELLENEETNSSYIMDRFVKKFFLLNFKSKNFNNFRRDQLDNYAVIKFGCSKFIEHLQIPLGQRTLKELKTITSWHFGITPNDLYFIGYENESTTDSEILTLKQYMTIHFQFILNFRMDVIVHEPIGKGSFGEIFLHKSPDETFAVKCNKETNILQREISIQSDLKYSKEVETYTDLYHYGDMVVIGMKYFEKKSLSEFIETYDNQLRKRRVSFLPEELIFRICYDLLIQINDLHKWNIVHRDIKSENVVLDENLCAKLIDFGCAKSINNLTKDELRKKYNSYTRGTVGYMAPEILKSEPYTTKADIWSFGIMVMEMITKNKNDSFKFSVEVQRDRFTLGLPPKCSTELKEFVSLCLKLSPDDRWSAERLLICDFMKKFSRN